MYILHEYIIIANAMYAKQTSFMDYNSINEYKKILCNYLSQEHDLIFFNSKDEIEVGNKIFYKHDDGVEVNKTIDEQSINYINSIYPIEIQKKILYINMEYMVNNDVIPCNWEGSQMTEIIDKIDELKKEEEKIKTNSDYIDWLVDFLKKEAVLTNSDLLYNSDRIKLEDKPNCDKLLLFIDVIKKYAQDNNISPIESEEGKYYYVNYNGSTLEICICPMYCHIKYEERNIEEVSINYEDILRNSIKEKRKGLMYH